MLPDQKRALALAAATVFLGGAVLGYCFNQWRNDWGVRR